MESIKTKQSELSGLLLPNKNVSQKNKIAKEEHHINVLIIIFETEFYFSRVHLKGISLLFAITECACSVNSRLHFRLALICLLCLFGSISLIV